MCDFSSGGMLSIVGLVLSFASFALAQGPPPPEQTYLASVVPLIESGKLSEAERRLVDGLGQYPQSAILNNALGMVYERERKTDDAIQSYERALHLSPSFTAAQIHLAALYANQGKCDLAVPLFSAAAISTSNASALGATGAGLAQCNQYSSAIPVLEKAHQVDPQSASITYNLALAYYRRGEFERSLQCLGSLSEEAGTDAPDLLYLRGKSMQGLKQAGSAEPLSKACSLQPHQDYCTDAAIELIREEHVVDAVELLETAINKLPLSANLLSILGLAQFKLGRYKDATASYSRAIELDPNNDAPREGLVFLYYMTGDLLQAKLAGEAAEKKGGADFYVNYLRGLVLYRMSRQLWPEALDAASAALHKNPNFAAGYYLRGKIRMEQKDLDAALSDFQMATRIDPKYALPYYKMTQIYLREGRQEDAKRAAEQFNALGSLREEEVLARQTQDTLLQPK